MLVQRRKIKTLRLPAPQRPEVVDVYQSINLQPPFPISPRRTTVHSPSSPSSIPVSSNKGFRPGIMSAYVATGICVAAAAFFVSLFSFPSLLDFLLPRSLFCLLRMSTYQSSQVKSSQVNSSQPGSKPMTPLPPHTGTSRPSRIPEIPRRRSGRARKSILQGWIRAEDESTGSRSYTTTQVRLSPHLHSTPPPIS